MWPSSLRIRAHAERMLFAREGKRALFLADPRLSRGFQMGGGVLFRSFDDLARECGPVEYLEQVSRYL